jgi:cholesterol oxidase
VTEDDHNPNRPAVRTPAELNTTVKGDAPSRVYFTEEMKGYVTFGETDYDRGFRKGKEDNTFLMFHLTITAEDVGRFLADSRHEASAVGYVRCPALGGDMPVEKGIFNLFVDYRGRLDKRMIYRLYLRNEKEGPLTLSGFKVIQEDPSQDVWADTTTLFTKILRGHVGPEEEATAEVLATGIIHIYHRDFLRQITTIRVEAPTLLERTEAWVHFGKAFFGPLWEVYGSRVAGGQTRTIRYPRTEDENLREIPLYTHEGVQNAAHETITFNTEDDLGLSFERFTRAECDDVVMIAHGLTTSTDMFIMPEHYNLVSYLLDNGFTDVWSLDFRMSNRHSYNLIRHRMTLDDIALFDYPAAIATMRERIGDRRIHVICHCLGSVSFMMSLFGKAVDGIASTIANSVALTPRVPRWSHIKLYVAPAFVEYVLGYPYLNPLWSYDPGLSSGKIFSKVNSRFHRECNVPACHMLSLMWGSGHPALYSHENLKEVTHRRGGDLYGGTSMNYYRHVRKMVRAGRAVKYDPSDPKYDRLPDDYLQYAREIETPVLFMTGESNRVFTDSNVYCYQKLEELVPGRHELHLFPNYGHQDVFMGKNNHIDIFPRLLEFLSKHAEPRPMTRPERREQPV